MLDYAANGVVYWPVGRLRGWLNEQVRGAEGEEQALRSLVGDDIDIEVFWAKVEENLRTGRIRMIFVADEIPSELQRIVEFLNEQLTSAEVLAVEVKHYEGAGLRALVPSVIGRTAAAVRLKPQGDTRRFADLLPEANDSFRECIIRLGAWAGEKHLSTGPTAKGWRVVTSSGDALVWAYPAWGHVEFAAGIMRERGDVADADQVVATCASISGRPATQTYPKLAAELVLSRWDEVRRDILEPLAASINESPPPPVALGPSPRNRMQP